MSKDKKYINNVGKVVNTLSQKSDRLEEGTPPLACCEAQIAHTAKLECHGLLVLPTSCFVLFEEE